MDFTHLHLHTEYSLLDGANKIDELAKRLKELNFKSCAITDHGVMFGAIHFYKSMKKHGIKPIIGFEGYLHDDDDLSSTATNRRWHICLFAKNQKGYENLMYLTSRAHIDGFYYRPRINKKLLKEYSEGIICSSACLAGEINWHLNDKEVRRNGKTNADMGAKGYEGAKAAALWYKEVFGDDFYLEIMRMGINSQLNIDTNILKLGRELGIKVIATNDSHYTYKDRAQAQNIFMAISTGDIVGVDPESDEAKKDNGLRHTMSEIYVKSAEEMHELFLDVPEVVQNTQEIVDKCEELKLTVEKPTPPNFKFALEYAEKIGLELPSQDMFSFSNDDVLFERLCWDGLNKRLVYIDESKHETYKERLRTEINIIKNMRFSGYMLIVHDFIKAAKDMGIPVGPGRGSAAGSLVSFCLEITDLDPLPYNLLFERFLNPDRVSMPDIDVDFCQNRREEVIDYVVKKYGRYNVAQVITFGKLLAKGVIRDVARVCDLRIKDADTLAKLVPDELKITLKDAYEKNPDIKAFIEDLDNRAEYKNIVCHPDDVRGKSKIGTRVWEYSLALEGLNRNAGMHAAGVVISNEELWKKTPLFKQPKSDALVTQYMKDYLEDVDLIKFDFLGLKTLTVIDNAIKLIKKRHNIDIDWNKIDVNDKGVYDLIQTGNTLGIFQIESSGMQDLNARLKPTCFEDLIAVLALYRPGPLDSGMVDDFIDIKHGRKPAVYAFPELKPILEPTYGVIVYQEQVMQVVQTIGGFSLGGADLVRRAMGKKKLEEMVKLKGEYLEGAIKQGFDEKKADDLWELILKFAEYGFNKSHSAAYALVAFQTAYLKKYYETEFMAALLTSEEGKVEKIEKYKDELDRLGIELLPPNINDGTREFNVTIKDGKAAIVYGLGSIKSFGIPSAEGLAKARADKPFSDMKDFIARADAAYMNKKGLEALAKTGCFECIGINRKSALNAIDYIINEFKAKKEHDKRLQESLFSQFETEYHSSIDITNQEEFSVAELAEFDKEYLGIYLGSHPLDEFKKEIKSIEHYKSSDFENLDDGEYQAFCLGIIEEVDFKQSKSGKSYANIKALDYYSNFNILCFNPDLIDVLASKYKAMNLAAQDVKTKKSLYAFILNLKRDNAKNTLFLNNLIEVNASEIGVNTDDKNALGYEVFSKKGGKKIKGDIKRFSHLTQNIEYLKSSDFNKADYGDYNAFCLGIVTEAEFKVSKKNKAFAKLKVVDEGGEFDILCFNDEVYKKLENEFFSKEKEENLYGFEVSLRADENGVGVFIDDFFLITNELIKEPSENKNSLGYVVFEKRIAKPRRQYSKENKEEFTQNPKAFEGEFIQIDLLNISAEILQEITRLIKENLSQNVSAKEIVLEFLDDSCVNKYSRRFGLNNEAIEKIKELSKIS